MPRLELLGYTTESAKAEYEIAAATWLEERKSYEEDAVSPPDTMTFADFRQFVESVALADLDNKFDMDGGMKEQRTMGRFKDEAFKARLPFYPNYDADAWSERGYFGTLLGLLDPYTTLRLLAENPRNLEARLEWQYGPLVANGWEKAEFVPSARRTQTYLIATEGSSDVHILKRAFQLLRPQIADFFRFIDVSERHPFSGTGSLVKFAKGLAEIDVQN